jgi:hypothetical protein
VWGVEEAPYMAMVYFSMAHDRTKEGLLEGVYLASEYITSTLDPHQIREWWLDRALVLGTVT